MAGWAGMPGREHLTIVTLSREPARPKAADVATLNWVSDFGGQPAALHAARMASIWSVQTPFFCWVDADDPVPATLPVPATAGLLYGTEQLLLSGNVLTSVAPQPWSRHAHLMEPRLIHKPIVRTAAAREAAALLPAEGEYYTELLLFFAIAKRHGVELRPDFVTQWEMGRSCMAGKVGHATANTARLLLLLEKRGVL